MITFKSHIKAQNKESLLQLLAHIKETIEIDDSGDLNIILTDPENQLYTGYWHIIKIPEENNNKSYGKTHTAEILNE